MLTLQMPARPRIATPEELRVLLVAYLARHKLSTRAAAERLGLSNASVSKWANGKGKPGRFFLTHLPPLLRK